MELLLNLFWLALALPGVWLWRRQSEGARNWQRPGCARALLLIGCSLVLLFPIVSASDDLHAMQGEMDEPCKVQVKQGGAHRSNARAHMPQSGFPAQLTASAWGPHQECCGVVSSLFVFASQLSSFAGKASRAPPSKQLI